MSDYRLQVVNAKTREVTLSWDAGGPVETELIEQLVQRTKDKGVGLFRSEAHVLSDIREAFGELLWDLKLRV